MSAGAAGPLVAAMCPRCGAGLKIEPGQAVARCLYCKAESQVVRPGTVSEGGGDLTIYVDPPRPDSRVAMAKLNIAVAALVGVAGVVAGAVLWSVTESIVPLLVLIGVGTLIALSMGWAKGTTVLAEVKAEEQFRARAEPMRATLEDVRDLGRGAVLDLGLSVTRPDGSSFRLSRRSRVPMVLVSRLHSGMNVPVLVDPEDPSRIEIPWHLVSADD